MTTSGALPQAQFGEGPFIFSGVPPILTGEIDLSNPSDEKIKVRSIPVVRQKGAAAKRIALTELRVGARLAPKQRVRASAHILIDPTTPPGSYSAEISLGADSRPIVAHVFENGDIQVDPPRIRLRGAAGDVLTTVVVVRTGGTSRRRSVMSPWCSSRSATGSAGPWCTRYEMSMNSAATRLFRSAPSRDEDHDRTAGQGHRLGRPRRAPAGRNGRGQGGRPCPGN